MKIKIIIPMIFLLSAFSFSANSHHSFPAVYDTSQRYLLEGTVSKFLFRNPHSFIFLDVADETGKVSTWHLEMPPHWALARFGVQQDLIQEGDEMLVVCNPSRKGAKTCGMGQQGGFFRYSDELVYGKDPREVKDAANR